MVKEILIEVNSRSVEREEVERYYIALLSRESLSCLAGRGVFAYQFRQRHRADLDDALQDERFPPPEPDVAAVATRGSQSIVRQRVCTRPCAKTRNLSAD